MTVRITQEGGTTVVTIDRPEVRNAVDRDTAAALARAFRDFEADADSHVAVLAGAGGTFCAGADLRAIADGRPNRLDPDGQAPMGPTRMVVSKPVIAAVAGHAVAGGLELACWADLRVVEEDAVLGVFCRRVGVPLIDGGTVRLPRIIGLGRALDLILTGRPVSAREALQMGLATRVVPRGEAVRAAVALAEQIASHPPAAMLADRASVYAGMDLSVADALAAEFSGGLPSLAEGVEGARRFTSGAVTPTGRPDGGTAGA